MGGMPPRVLGRIARPADACVGGRVAVEVALEDLGATGAHAAAADYPAARGPAQGQTRAGGRLCPGPPRAFRRRADGPEIELPAALEQDAAHIFRTSFRLPARDLGDDEIFGLITGRSRCPRARDGAREEQLFQPRPGEHTSTGRPFGSKTNGSTRSAGRSRHRIHPQPKPPVRRRARGRPVSSGSRRTVTSTSAVRRGRPQIRWACAPNRYPRAPTARAPRPVPRADQRAPWTGTARSASATRA